MAEIDKTTQIIKAAFDRISTMSQTNAIRTINSVHGLVIMQDDPEFVAKMATVMRDMADRWKLSESALSNLTLLDMQGFDAEVQTRIDDVVKRAEELAAQRGAVEKTEEQENDKNLQQGVAKFMQLIKGGDEDRKRIPKVDRAYVVRPKVKSLWKALVLAAGIWGHPPTVKLTGDPGTGKTMMAQQFAANLSAVFYKVDCAMFAEPGDLYGKQVPSVDENGRLQLVWKDSPFSEAITRGNCVILIDELTRLNYAGQNSLLPLLDGTGEVQPDGRPSPIRRASGVFIFASCNEGVRHAGTYEITEALQSRMAIVFESENLNESEIKTVLEHSLRPSSKPGTSVLAKEKFSVVEVTENIMTLIWRFVNRIREKQFEGGVNLVEEIIPPSPRELFWLARMIHTGGDEAWEWCIYNRYSKDGMGSGAGSNPRSVVAAVRAAEVKKWVDQQKAGPNASAVAAEMAKTRRASGVSTT